MREIPTPDAPIVLALPTVLARAQARYPDATLLDVVSAELRALPMPDADRAGERLRVIGIDRPAPAGHARRTYRIIGEDSEIHYTTADITLAATMPGADPVATLETWGLILQISLNGPRRTHPEEIDALGVLRGCDPWRCERCGAQFADHRAHADHAQGGC